ncbi:MAG: aminopeptidase P family protein [Reichenbachiella sp.]
MSQNRRKFIQNSLALTSAAALSTGLVSCKNEDVNKQKSFKSMVNDVKFITAEERLYRIEKARELMTAQGVDAVYLDSGTSMRYFVDLSWHPSERMMGVLIPRKGDIQYICPKFEDERLNELISIKGQLRTWDEHESPYDLVGKILKDLGISEPKIGMEERVRYFIANGIQKAIPSATIVDGTPVVAGCRSIKSNAELALLKRANEITLEAYRIGFSNLKEGMTQYDLNDLIYEAFLGMGATESGWVGASFGKYSAFPHGSKEPSRLKEGDIVLVDGGCILGGYQADITRTTVFGVPSQRQKDIWNVVKEAQTAVYEIAKAGVPCQNLDAVARQVIEQSGFGKGYENFFHRVGHGIGMDFHEWEYLVKGNEKPMALGMCFSNEPGIYLYDEFGVRLEDCWYATENGYEAFTPQSPSIENPIG